MTNREVVVEVENGRLLGERRLDRGLSFKGIPYADDTGGRNRFLPPQPVKCWSGMRDARTFGDRCPQIGEDATRFSVFAWYGQDSPFSENCCVLNVFTPDLDNRRRRPVIFYIHGGGYASGGGGSCVLDGGNLAIYGDVVVVTVNHRLNVFGYTDLSFVNDSEDFEHAANLGQLDLVAALQWVHRNISSFSGDPNNVTLVGQSGGGNKIMALMAMPSAKDLFQRAINMSGATGLQIRRQGATEQYVLALLKNLEIKKGNLSKIQSVPVAALLKARSDAISAVRDEGAQPIVDGRSILASPFTTQGLQYHADKPLMLGTTDTEAMYYLARDRNNLAISLSELRSRMRKQFALSEQGITDVIDQYYRDDPGRQASDILCHIASDVLVRGRMIRAAEAKAASRAAPVYLYNFTWKIPLDKGGWGSPHTVDIPFAFGNVEHSQAMTGEDKSVNTVSHNLMSAFVAFARCGNPSNGDMPSWLPYERLHRATMTIGEHCSLVNDFHGAGRHASEQLLSDAQPTSLLRGPLFRGVR